MDGEEREAREPGRTGGSRGQAAGETGGRGEPRRVVGAEKPRRGCHVGGRGRAEGGGGGGGTPGRAPGSVRADGALGRRRPGPWGGVGGRRQRRGRSWRTGGRTDGRTERPAARRGGLGWGGRAERGVGDNAGGLRAGLPAGGTASSAKRGPGRGEVDEEEAAGSPQDAAAERARPRPAKAPKTGVAAEDAASTRGPPARWRGREAAGAAGRGGRGPAGLAQLRRRAGEEPGPTRASYSRGAPLRGARSGPAGHSPAPMGARGDPSPAPGPPRPPSQRVGVGARARAGPLGGAAERAGARSAWGQGAKNNQKAEWSVFKECSGATPPLRVLGGTFCKREKGSAASRGWVAQDVATTKGVPHPFPSRGCRWLHSWREGSPRLVLKGARGRGELNTPQSPACLGKKEGAYSPSPPTPARIVHSPNLHSPLPSLQALPNLAGRCVCGGGGTCPGGSVGIWGSLRASVLPARASALGRVYTARLWDPPRTVP